MFLFLIQIVYNTYIGVIIMNTTHTTTTNPYPNTKPYVYYHTMQEFQKQIAAAFAHTIATGNNGKH